MSMDLVEPRVQTTHQRYKYALPTYPLDGMTVLDVGCQTGKDFLYPCFRGAKSLHGIDVDRAAIEHGQQHYPQFNLQVARAESLPFEAETFDCVLSRVALPYTDIPRALREIHRVLKPGGRLYISMHDFGMQVGFLRDAIRHLDPRHTLFQFLAVCAGIIFHFTGKVIPITPSGRRESFQTVSRMYWEMEKIGFSGFCFQRTDRHRIFEAVKTTPPATE